MQGYPSRNDSHCLAGKPRKGRHVVPCSVRGSARVPLQRSTGGSDAVCWRNNVLIRIITLAAIPAIATLFAFAGLGRSGSLGLGSRL